jgi:enamine deaminase RidA (YjgF/YER057c/UK114 family)
MSSARRIAALCATGVLAPVVLGCAGCERPPPPAPPERVRQDFHLNAYEKDFGYSQAVLIDKTLFISGTVAVDADGRLVAPGDMAGQMRAIYANLKRTLEANGVGFDSVVKETIYTTDMNALLKADDLRFEYYSKEHLPAVSWVQVERLLDPGFLVEIEVVAELP